MLNRQKVVFQKWLSRRMHELFHSSVDSIENQYYPFRFREMAAGFIKFTWPHPEFTFSILVNQSNSSSYYIKGRGCRRPPYYCGPSSTWLCGTSLYIPRMPFAVLSAKLFSPSRNCFILRSDSFFFFNVKTSIMSFYGHKPHFLEACFLCRKPLGCNADIFMYRLAGRRFAFFIFSLYSICEAN